MKALKQESSLKTDHNASLLLCPNVPAPMHGTAPRVVLGASWWDKERKAAFAKALYRCEACGVEKEKAIARQWLEGHELYDINYIKGRMTYLRTVSLCHYCHNFIHDGRLKSLLETGKISHEKYTSILRHGDRILRGQGLKRKPRAEREKEIEDKISGNQFASWSTWRLVVNGKRFPPKFSSREEYDKYWKENR